ncbi:DUF4262 domain-containing protein [Actinomycetospora sp. C-140]
MAGLMSAYGWAVQFVERYRDRPPFAYTLGLTPRGLPELVVTASGPEQSMRLLNAEATRVLTEGPPRPGDRRVMGDGREAEVVALPHPDAHLFVAVDFFGADLRALQLVRADDRGRWPWEVGHRAGRGGQPVLGPRAEPSRGPG